MKVLLSAIACHPERGSEGAVGWKSALALSRAHQVHVLTHTDNKKSIEEYVETHGLTNPTFTYFGAGGPYHENRLLARAQSWLRYLKWTRSSLYQAQLLIASRSFDLVHHVTFSTYRVASPLWKLGLPFILGPVGGGEKLPWIAAGSMSRGQQLHEIVRLMANTATRISLGVRRSICNSAVLLASNQATADTLISLGADPNRVRKLPVVFFTDDQITALRCRSKPVRGQGDRLEIFSSGMLEGRKGLGIALHALRIAKSSGLSLHFTISSRGPEFSYLKKLSSRLGIDDIVDFPDSLPREKYWETLLASDIYLAPSLRDNCPATLLEAMLCRCVPIVANCSGPGEIVSHDVGELVEPDHPERMAENIAAKLVKLAGNRSELMRKAEIAGEFTSKTFTEFRYLQRVEEAYAIAVANDAANKRG
jgi:glycosyltransferase involved in cell wall biosynthesis